MRINLPNFVQAYRYDSSREGSDSMIFNRQGKCRHGIPSHTVPLRALVLIYCGAWYEQPLVISEPKTSYMPGCYAE